MDFTDVINNFINIKLTLCDFQVWYSTYEVFISPRSHECINFVIINYYRCVINTKSHALITKVTNSVD